MTTTRITPVPRTHNPFPTFGITRDEEGVAHYDDLPETLVAMLRHQVDRGPDREAVVELGGERLSYQQLWERTGRVAGGLRALGVTDGDRVALRYPAGVDWVLAFWGTLLAGGIPVAVNIRFAGPEVRFVLDDSGSSIDLAADTPLPDGEPYVGGAARCDDVAGLFYTSGTTGRPKGVPTTHEAFLSNCENVARCAGVPREAGGDFRTLITVPLFHVTGCNTQLLIAAYVGGTAIIMPALDPARLAAVVESERISCLITVPAVYALLLRRSAFAGVDLSGVRWVLYGGAPIASALVAEIKSTFPAAQVMNGYGMTETASALTVLPDSDAEQHADSVGYAAPVVDLAVDARDASGVGELLARAPNVLRGYWNRDDATAEAFVDGWLRTGDIVRVDDAGRIHIVDRAKDIINRGGEKVSSVAVEEALVGAPGVTEAAVIAVPDEVMGEKVGAVVVVEGELDVDAIIEHCRARLGDFQVPQYLTASARPLPRNAGGKLLKAQLREQVEWGEPLR